MQSTSDAVYTLIRGSELRPGMTVYRLTERGFKRDFDVSTVTTDAEGCRQIHVNFNPKAEGTGTHGICVSPIAPVWVGNVEKP